jgi:glycerol-3-phosphate acyltransferase PlsY
MVETWTSLGVAVAGYLIGSVSFSRLVARWKGEGERIQDVRIQLPENLGEAEVEVFGANRASMALGARFGLTVAVLDILKAAIPALLMRIFFPGEPYDLVIAFFCLVGHNWPIYHRFRGGRGFSTIFGGFLIFEPLGLLIAILLGNLLGMVVFGNPAMAYVLWLPLMIPIAWLRTRDVLLLLYAVVVCAVFFASTIPEMRTLRRFRREGKYEAYMQALYQSSPRWRGMNRMTQRLRFWVPRNEERIS